MVSFTPSAARERILDTADLLFSQRGIRDVGVDELVAVSRVANATFYRHFPSKDKLVLAFLDRWGEIRMPGIVVHRALAGDGDAREQFLAIFDGLDSWFRGPDFEGDATMNVLIEMGPEHTVGKASLNQVRAVFHALRERARRAGYADPDDFAYSFQILMRGAIIAAQVGDVSAATRSKVFAGWLLENQAA